MSYAGKISIDNGALLPIGSTLFGVCETPATTALKLIRPTAYLGANFTVLIDGVTVHIKFKYGNTVTNGLQLKIGDTDAKPISNPGGSFGWPQNALISFTYDGEEWLVNDGLVPAAGVVEDTYDPNSSNAISGKGVAEAIAPLVPGGDSAASYSVDTEIGGNPSTSRVPTSYAVADYVERTLEAENVMIYKGTVGTGGSVSHVPTSGYSAGWLYKVATAGIYVGEQCEEGDLILAIRDAEAQQSNIVASHWMVIQKNLVNAVIGPLAATRGHVAVFGASSTEIADSGYTIEANVPSNALFTDTTYDAAANGGLNLNDNTNEFSIDFGTGHNQAVRGDDVRLSDDRAPLSHTHGNISNDGTLAAVSKAVVTDDQGAITTRDLTTTATDPNGTNPVYISNVEQDAQGKLTINKSRLPDATTSTPGITTVGASGGAAAYDHNHDGTYAAANHTHTFTGHEGESIYVDSTSGNLATTDLTTSDPEASGTTNTFIDTISQDSKGKITPTKKALAAATSSAIGGIKVGYTTDNANRNYAIELDQDTNKAYVNVPWIAPTDMSFGQQNANLGMVTDSTGAVTTKDLSHDSNDNSPTAVEFIKRVQVATDGTITTTKGALPTVGNGQAGIVPAGTTVTTQTQSTKFLREDGTWEVPSYTTNTDSKVEQIGINVTGQEELGDNLHILLKKSANTTDETDSVKYVKTQNAQVTINTKTGKVSAPAFEGTNGATNAIHFIGKATSAGSADMAAQVPWSGVQNTPTTLQGYGITDAATSTHKHGAINNDGTMATASRAVVTDANKNIALVDMTTNDPSVSNDATATEFISNIAQNSQGKISTLIKKQLPAASSSVAGIMKLGASGGAATYDHDHDSTYAPKSHTHGNIQNGGTLQATDVMIGNGDKLVITDVSDSNKIARTSIEFDGSTETNALTPKGTWKNYRVVKQNANTENKEFSILLKTTNNVNEETGEVKFGATTDKLVTINPSTGKITAPGGLAGTASRATADASGNTITTTYAPLTSPVFTGAPKSVTPASNSDSKMIATKEYVDNITAANDAMIFKGILNGAVSTTYTPAADRGWTYKVVTAGKINGENVEVGDTLICITDGTVAATADNVATVKQNWVIVQANIDGAVTGPTSNGADGNIVVFNGTSGRLIKDSTKALSTTAPANTSTDSQIPTSKAVWSAISNLVLDNANYAVVTDGNKKVITEDLSSDTPAASGTATAFITGITQNAKGKLTSIIKANLPTASDSTAGIVKLGASGGAATFGHTHGNITNGGILQTTDVAIANGDKLVITDASDSDKIACASISFDGVTITKALTQKGTWETFNNYNLPLAENGTRGGIQIGYSTSGQNYAVQLDNEKAYVNVPWTDQNVAQTADTSNNNIPILLKGTTGQATVGAVKYPNTTNKIVTVNPSTGAITAPGGFLGTASTATSWTNARKVYVALGIASTTTTINGGASNAAAIGIGVDGILAVTHGGTGVNTTNDIFATYGIEYIVGTQTASTGDWTGTTNSTSLYVGKTIAYKLPYKGSGNATLELTFPDGTKTGKQAVYAGDTRLTTHYPANSIMLMVWNGTEWRTNPFYDTNTDTKLRTYASETNISVPLIGSSSANSTTAAWSTYTETYKNWYGVIPNDDAKRAKINLSTGHMTVPGGITTNITGTAEKATADASGNIITSTYAPLASPALIGTPTAPTAANGTNTTQIATTAFVNNTLSYINAMRFKGTLGTNGTVSTLPATHEAGDTYRVITAGTWAGKYCEEGTLIICVADGTTTSNADWTSVETNEDGAVIGPSSSTTNAIAKFSSTTGRVIASPTNILIDNNDNLVLIGTVASNSTGSTATYDETRAGPKIIFNDDGQKAYLIGDRYDTSGDNQFGFTLGLVSNQSTVSFRSNGIKATSKLVVNSIFDDTYAFKVAGSSWMNGILTLYRETTTANNYAAGIVFSNKDTTTAQTQNTSYIYTYNTHSADNNGMNMVIQSAGNVFVGGGESPANLYATLETSTSKNLYLTADNIIYFEGGCSNTIANRIGFALDSGNIVPVKAEAANSNAQNLGTSDNKWANVYATTFTGALAGNADTATKLKDDASNTTASFWRGDNSWSDTISGGTLKITNQSTTLTLGAQNTSYVHFTNSARYEYYFDKKIHAVTGFKVYDKNTSLTDDNLTFNSGGGWCMTDTTWIRTVGSKSVYMNTGIFRNDGTTLVRILMHANANIIEDGSWTTNATGTAGDGSTAGTLGKSYLSIGNNIGQTKTNGSGKDNSKGYLYIYGSGTGAVEITYNDSMLVSNKSLYLSNTANSGISNEVRGIMAKNDYWRIAGGATTENSGYLEIATANEGTESIYVKQYTDTFSTALNVLTLLDANGDSSFPGDVLPNTTNLSSLGTSTYRWKSLFIGTDDTYGDAYTPIYWNNGVPTAITIAIKMAFTIANNYKGVQLNHTAFTTASIVSQIVITNGESNLNAVLNWVSGDGWIKITTDSQVSGVVSGYIIVNRGSELTATSSSNLS